MRVLRASVAAVVCVFLLAGSAAAQRGGGGRGMQMGGERVATPTTYENPDLGLAFDVPIGLQLYTPAAPGRYKSQLGEGRLFYVAYPDIRGASLVARSSGDATDADIKAYKDILDTNPPQAKLEGFKKHSVRFIKVGKNHDKDALEFVYDAQLSTFRQVVLVHNGKGITITCTSLQAQAGGAENEMLKPLLSRLEFR